MSSTSEFNKGDVILLNNDPSVITKKEFYAPCKGGSFNRMEFRNLKTGQVIRQTVRSGEKLEVVDVDNKTVQFLYADDSYAYFMDPDTFEQSQVELAKIDGGSSYLVPELKCIATFYEEKIITIKIPLKIEIGIADTLPAVKGNTSGNALKEATTETGGKVSVPLFINAGDRILMSTDTGAYVSKA